MPVSALPLLTSVNMFQCFIKDYFTVDLLSCLVVYMLYFCLPS